MKDRVVNKEKEYARLKLATIYILLVLFAMVPTLFAQETGANSVVQPKSEVKVEAPKLLAVEFYADWCAGCKELMPKMTEIRKNFQSKQVMSIRFDQTDDYTKAQSSFLASFAGLEEVYKKAAGKTGLIALVNPKTKQIYGLITRVKTPEEIIKMIDDALTKTETAK